jgi:hypothetical protein
LRIIPLSSMPLNGQMGGSFVFILTSIFLDSIVFHVLFELGGLNLLIIIPVNSIPKPPRAHIMTMKREFSLAEGNAIALSIRNDARKRLFLINPHSQISSKSIFFNEKIVFKI